MTMGMTVREGPVYQALEQATAQFLAPVFTGMRAIGDFDTMPIGAVRAYAEARGVVPHAQLFGEEYERKVVKAWGRWFTERDSKSILDLLETLLLVQIDRSFSLDRTHLDLCFSPTPYRQYLDQSYEQYLVHVVGWLLPFWSEVGNLTIRFCVSWSRVWYMNSAFSGARSRVRYVNE